MHDVDVARMSGHAVESPDALQPGECIIADSGYQGLKGFLVPVKGKVDSEVQKLNSLYMSKRQLIENVFSRQKHFKILRDPFRGDLNHHGYFYDAITKVVNADMYWRPMRSWRGCVSKKIMYLSTEDSLG